MERDYDQWYRGDWNHDSPILLVDTGPLDAWVTSVVRGARSSRLNFLSATICPEALEVFSNIYSPTIGRDVVMDYLLQKGMDALKGADILNTAPGKYSSTVEYAGNTMAQYMRDIAQVHLAELGTRFLYTTAPSNSFDTHAAQAGPHARLCAEWSAAVSDFHDDLATILERWMGLDSKPIVGGSFEQLDFL